MREREMHLKDQDLNLVVFTLVALVPQGMVSALGAMARAFDGFFTSWTARLATVRRRSAG